MRAPIAAAITSLCLTSASWAEYVPLNPGQRVSGFHEQRQITCYEKIGGIIRSQARYTLQPSGDLVSNGYTLSQFERFRYPDDSSGDTYMHKWIKPNILRRYKYIGSSTRVQWSEDYDFSKQQVSDAGRGYLTCFSKPKPMGMPIEYLE